MPMPMVQFSNDCSGSTGNLSLCDLLFLEKNIVMIAVETNILDNKKCFALASAEPISQ